MAEALGNSVGVVYVDVVPRYAGGAAEIGQRIGQEAGAGTAGGGGGSVGWMNVPSGADDGRMSSSTIRYAAAQARYEYGRVAQLQTYQRLGEMTGGAVGMNAESTSLIGRAGIQERVDRSFDMAGLSQQKASERQVQQYRELQYRTTDQLARQENAVANRVGASWDMAGLAQQRAGERQVAGYRNLAYQTSERLGREEAAEVSRENRALNNQEHAMRMESHREAKRDVSDATKAARYNSRLAMENFQADVAPMSFPGQHSAILDRAAHTADPLEAARLRKQAGRMARHTGMGMEVMSTGQYMNVLFGGMEVFHSANAFGQAGLGATAESRYTGYMGAAETVNSGFLGSFAGMMIGAGQEIAGIKSIYEGSKAQDIATLGKREFSEYTRTLGRDAASASAFGSDRARIDAKRERDVEIEDRKKRENDVVNKVKEAQSHKLVQIEERYNSDMASASYGDRPSMAVGGWIASKITGVENTTAGSAESRRASAMAELDEEVKKARSGVGGKGAQEIEDIYQYRIRDIENSETARLGMRSAKSRFNRDIAKGVPVRRATILRMQRERDAALALGVAADSDDEWNDILEEGNAGIAAYKALSDPFAGQEAQSLAIRGMRGVANAMRYGRPDEATRRGGRASRALRWEKTPSQLRRGLGPLDEDERVIEEMGIANDTAMRTLGLSNRENVSSILARDTSPTRGIAASAAGIAGSAAYEAEGYARSSRFEEGRTALRIGENNLEAYRTDIFQRGMSAVSGSQQYANLSGAGTSKPEDIGKAMAAAVEQLRSANTKLGAIEANTKKGAVTGP